MKRILATCLVAGGLAVSQAAKADIIFTLDLGSSGPSGFVPGAYEWAYMVTLTPGTPASHIDADSWAAIQDIPGYISGPGLTYFDPWIFDPFTQPYVQGIVETGDSPRFGGDSALMTDVELVLGPSDLYGPEDIGMLYFQNEYDPTGPLQVGNVLWELTDDAEFVLNQGDGSIFLPVPVGGDVPEASTVVAASFMGLLGAGYIVRRRRQAAPVA